MNEIAKIRKITPEDMDDEKLVTYGTEAFLSKEYLEAEKKLLWPKVWQWVERIEDFPEVGDWMTYNVADESIILMRVAPGDTVESFRKAQPGVQVHVYAADHGFNCNERASYDEAAANSALERTLAFFNQHLG